MTSLVRRSLWLRRLALLCAALVLAITSLSAYLRLAKAGLGCEPWPQCYSQSERSPSSLESAAPAPDIGLARLTHRAVAVAALLVIIAMVMNAWSVQPVQAREGRMALGLLALALFLAVLGRATGNSRHPGVTVGNVLAGFALLALSWRLATTAGRGADGWGSSKRPTAGRIWIVLCLLAGATALGGVVGPGPERVANVAWWQLLHGIVGLTAAVMLVLLSARAWRGGQRAQAAVLLSLLVVEMGLGAILHWTGATMALALAHNIAGALLLAAVAGIPHRRRNG